MSDKMPLNDVLNAIDKRDFDWYSRLPMNRKRNGQAGFSFAMLVL